MQIPLRAAAALLVALAVPALAAGQPLSGPTDRPVVGTLLPDDVIRDLPIADNVYAALETMQNEVIADRFNNGGLNVGEPARVGGFLGSWSQTLFRIGDLDVSDPSGSGAPLLFPETIFWHAVRVDTAAMPADMNTPGLAVTMEPRRAGDSWVRMFSAAASGGSLNAQAPVGQAPPIARLKDYAHGSALVSGPLSDRLGLVAGGTWTSAASYRREQLAGTREGLVSGFAHLTFTPSEGREWRALAWLQHAATPLGQGQPFQQPLATTADTSIHLQSTFENHQPDAASWRVFAGFTQRARTNDNTSSNIVLERISAGPVPDAVTTMADSTSRRLQVGGRFQPQGDRHDSRHRVELGADLKLATLNTTHPFAGIVQEDINGAPARIWSYSLGTPASSRKSTTASIFAGDVIALSPHASLDTSIRVELVHGMADGAANGVTWTSILPRAFLRWEFAEGLHLGLVGGYERTANALTLNWLAYGDPGAPVANVASAALQKVLVARVGPGTGGNTQFSQIDSSLGRPYTDEWVIGLESRGDTATRYALTGIARRESNLLGVVNTGVPTSSYSTITLQDKGTDWVGNGDIRDLTVYNRLPSSFGLDKYIVTNSGQQAATMGALELTVSHTAERLWVLFGASASAALGEGGNPGYGPLENDQDQPGTLFTNPNASSYARGRLFSDRAFTIKWSTMYRFPGDITVGGIARYHDGQPFARMVVVPGLNQGTEAVQAYPNAGSRFTFTGTLDLRVQKGFTVGNTHLAAVFDAYNLFTRSNEVEEFVVSSQNFRMPTAIQPPRTLHLGLRVTF